MSETSADEDVLAIDAEVSFPESPVRVQIKCTSSLKIAGRTASWKLEEQWVKKWNASKIPAYFVLVLVPPEIDTWLLHSGRGTNMHQTAAYWQRVDLSDHSSTLSIPKRQRLTVESFAQWHQDVLSVFQPTVGRK